MSWRTRFRPQRTVAQLYLLLGFLFLCVVLATAALVRAVISPVAHAERTEGLRWVGEGVLAGSDDPVRLQQQLWALQPRIPLVVSVFSSDGQVLASTETTPRPRLSAAQLETLNTTHVLALASDTLAVSSVTSHRDRYAVITLRENQRFFRIAGLVFVGMMLVLGAGAVPLARRLTGPLERLASAARAFGLGDLRARAEPQGPVELGELARTFNQMADRVESLRRAEKELLANISHELRIPLARIRVVVELATEEDPSVAKRYLAEIAEDLTEVEQILGDIITTARLDLANERSEDPNPPLRRTLVPIGVFLESVTKRFRERYPARALFLTLDDSLMVSVDRVMFKHALTNLLDNAYKYSPAERPVEVKVHRSEDGRAVIIKVIDRGQGISKEDLAYVFTPFFRADRSRTRDTGGTGLGLTLTKRIVEAHGGQVTLESRPGEETIVTMVLPLPESSI